MTTRRWLSIFALTVLVILGLTAAVTSISIFQVRAPAFAPNQNMVHLSTNCGTQANCFPLNPSYIDNSCTWTASSTTVACSDAPFTAANVTASTIVWGASTCNPYLAVSTVLQMTATHLTATYSSSTQITLSGDPAHAATTTGCLIWGVPSDTGAAAADTYAQGLSYCAHIQQDSGNAIFTTPHFFTNPPACLALPSLFPYGAAQTNMFYAAGFSWSGAGNSVGPTNIYTPPDFPETGSCAQHPPSGVTQQSCWFVPISGTFAHLSFNGGGLQTSTGMPDEKAYLTVDVGTLEDVTCTNIQSDPGDQSYGIYASHWAQLRQVDASGCGQYNYGIDPTALADFDHVIGENAAGGNFYINAGTVHFTSSHAFTSQFSDAVGIWNHGGTVWWDGGVGQSSVVAQNSGATAYYCDAAGCQFRAHEFVVVLAGSGNVNSIDCSATCTNYLNNSILATHGTGKDYIDGSASSLLFDQGGNTLGSSFTVTGQIMGEANSANATPVTAAKLVLSSGWGSTAAWTSLSGGDFPIQGTITNSGTGQGASPTITYTFPTPLLVAPFSCAAVDPSGTNTLGTFTISSLTATGVVFTFSLTPTVSDTELVQINCVTP
jgi:hypothetical protein